MQGRKNLDCKKACSGPRQGRIHPRFTVACFVLMATLTGAAQTAATPLVEGLRTDKADLATPINQPPDANAQMQMRDQQAKQPDYAVANAERKMQIASDSAKLLKLATDLKAEVDK